MGKCVEWWWIVERYKVWFLQSKMRDVGELLTLKFSVGSVFKPYYTRSDMAY